MKRCLLSVLAAVTCVSMVISCLSFSSFAFETVPLISVQPSGGYFATINDSPNGLIPCSAFAGNSIAKLRITNTNNLLNQYLMYQFIVTPQLVGSGNVAIDWENFHCISGNHNLTAVGAENVSVRTNVIDYGDLTNDGIAYNHSLLVTVSFIINNANASQITISFTNPTQWIYYNGNNNFTLRTYISYLGSFVSYSQGFNNIITTLGHIENSIVSRMPNISGYSYSTVVRNIDGDLTVQQNTGSWWDAILETLKNLSFDLDRSIAYQNQIDAGSIDETGDALGIMLEELNNSNAYGVFSSFPVTEISGNTDPGQLASILSTSLPVWWTQQVKDAIDAVAASRNADQEEWVLPYSDAKEHLDEVLGLSGGD